MLANRYTLKPIAIAAVAALAVLAGPTSVDRLLPGDGSWMSAAVAEEGGSGKNPGKAGGHHGARPEDKGGPKWTPGSLPWPEGKGPPADSDYWNRDGRPPRFGGDPIQSQKPPAGTQGGAPAWTAQELVDIGRLNVARAPAAVLARSEANALAELSSNYADFYAAAANILVSYQSGALTADAAKTALADLLRTAGALRIDSPLANLAFYKDITDDGVVKKADGTVVFSALNPDGTINSSLLTAYQSIFLGGAADKTKTVTEDTVHAVDIIMGFEQPTPKGETPTNADQAQDAYLAIYADAFREAIVVVHDE